MSAALAPILELVLGVVAYIGGPLLVAAVVSALVVEALDVLHLVYRPDREDPQRPRHEPEHIARRLPERDFEVYYLAELMHDEASHPHPHARRPIGDRLEALDRTYQHWPEVRS